MADQAYFVGVGNPDELRKNILNSSRTVITSLKRYEAYRDMNTLTVGLLGDLKQTIAEICVLNSRLKRVMPRTKILSRSSRPEIVKEVKKMEPVYRETSKLDTLQDELARIEKKLSELE